jgi:hypothetical protein
MIPGVTNHDFISPCVAGYGTLQCRHDGEHDIEISLYLRLGNEECGVVDSGEAWIRDGVLEAKFDYLDNEIPARYYKQVERVFGKPQPHAPKKK